MTDCFSEAVCDLFNRSKQIELLMSIEASHHQLLERRQKTVEYGDPKVITPKKRTASSCRLLQQALLHRAEHLISSSGALLLDGNVYGLALIVRGHVEATATLGYFCNRLESLANGNIKFEDLELNIADAILGAKHSTFSKARPPLNILTSIQKADKYLDKHLFKEKNEVLMDCYSWLSDFAHPNFLSASSAFVLDKTKHTFNLRHDSELQESDFQLVGYLDISTNLFLFLFDAFVLRADEGLAE